MEQPTNPEAIDHTCSDCGDPFLYTAAEQRFRAEQGMAPPSLCPRCRAERRAERNIDLVSATAEFRQMPPRDRDRRRPRRGNGNGGGSQDRHPAICADCGEPTMVPFIPRGDRPVYCRSCFNARRGR